MANRIRRAGRKAWDKAVGLWLRRILRKYYKKVLALRYFHHDYGLWERIFMGKARRQWKAERRLWKEKQLQIKILPAAIVALTLVDGTDQDSEIRKVVELMRKAMDLDPEFFEESEHGEFTKKLNKFLA